MSISESVENSILNLIFSATAWAGYAVNHTSSPETNIHVGLHTADPTDSGTMSSSESAYTNYARQNVARSTGWTTSTTGSVSPAANIDFPASGASGTTITHFSTGKTGGGAAIIIWSGTVTPNITISAASITPRLTTATVVTLD